MAHCARIRPTGPAALGCLQRNASSLSPRCRMVVSAIGSGPGAVGARPARRPAPAPAQAAGRQPANAQQALRSACRRDFMAYCSRVRPTGSAALSCLQRNAGSLSPRCGTAVSAAGGGAAPSAARPVATNQPGDQSQPPPGANVAFVEAVSGRVVVFAHGKPALLENSDLIGDRTRLDLQPDSELRFCHFKANRLLTLRGPRTGAGFGRRRHRRKRQGRQRRRRKLHAACQSVVRPAHRADGRGAAPRTAVIVEMITPRAGSPRCAVDRDPRTSARRCRRGSTCPGS